MMLHDDLIAEPSQGEGAYGKSKIAQGNVKVVSHHEQIHTMPRSHTETTYAKILGLSSTPKPAMISITPATSMKLWPLKGSIAATCGARYRSQSANIWKNLSIPAMTGAKKNIQRSAS